MAKRERVAKTKPVTDEQFARIRLAAGYEVTRDEAALMLEWMGGDVTDDSLARLARGIGRAASEHVCIGCGINFTTHPSMICNKCCAGSGNARQGRTLTFYAPNLVPEGPSSLTLAIVHERLSVEYLVDAH